MRAHSQLCIVRGCARATAWIAYVGWVYDNPAYGGVRGGPEGLCDAHKKLLDGPILAPVELISYLPGARRWIARSSLSGGPFPKEVK